MWVKRKFLLQDYSNGSARCSRAITWICLNRTCKVLRILAPEQILHDAPPSLSHRKGWSLSKLSELVAVECDRTNVNTENRLLGRLEIVAEHKLHWFVCWWHTNEFPLRHLIQKIDGKTSWPQQSSGAIGESLETCEALTVAIYIPIPVSLHEIQKKTSVQTKDFFLIFEGIHGSVPSRLSKQEFCEDGPIKMAHFR